MTEKTLVLKNVRRFFQKNSSAAFFLPLKKYPCLSISTRCDFLFNIWGLSWKNTSQKNPDDYLYHEANAFFGDKIAHFLKSPFRFDKEATYFQKKLFSTSQ